MSKQLEFWFEFGSPYSYPTAARIERLAQACSITIIWRPFLLGPIFREQGWEDSPFNIYPTKGAYMWRDMERLCAALDLASSAPASSLAMAYWRPGLRVGLREKRGCRTLCVAYMTQTLSVTKTFQIRVL